MTRLAFLHTAASHAATFGALAQSLAPGLVVHHRVDEALLADARRLGVDDPAVVARVQSAMRAAAAEGAAAVAVCTCSTIGGVAEAMGERHGFAAMRIDRAMADAAVAAGSRLLVVAALASTIAPTCALLADSARRLAATPVLETCVVEGAWAAFERGDTAGYLDAIVAAVQARASADDIDAIVLAQASMAPAAERLAPRPVFASPRLGVQAAIDRLHFLATPETA